MLRTLLGLVLVLCVGSGVFCVGCFDSGAKDGKVVPKLQEPSKRDYEIYQALEDADKTRGYKGEEDTTNTVAKKFGITPDEAKTSWGRVFFYKRDAKK